MGVNRGKQFEEQVEEGFKKIPQTSVYRLQDSMGGYNGVANICDYIIYKYPIQFFIECKSHHGNTIPIYSNNPKKKYGVFTNKQWEGMSEQEKIFGVVAGAMMWFIDHDKTYFVPMFILRELREQGCKSVNIKDISQMHQVIEIKSRKKRVLFEYDFEDFLKIFCKM